MTTSIKMGLTSSSSKPRKMGKRPIQLLRLGALRTVTTAVAARSPPVSEAAESKPLYRLLSNGNVAETLDRWSAEGGTVTTPHLVKQVRALCKFRRHKEALEVMDWIGKKGLDMSSGNHALCLDLLSKVNGIDSAENYFLSLSPDPIKDERIYGALLYCYCRKRTKNKAVALYEKMKKLNLPLNVFVYNNLMSLYMRLNRPNEVPDLFREMKASNISPDNCSCRVLIKSYASMNDIDSVERAVQDIEGSEVSLDWFTYCCLAEIYNSAGLFEKADIALKKAELVMDGRDLSPFPFLIRLHAAAGNLTEVKKVWKLLKAREPRPKNELYLVMLQALRRLDDTDGLEHCFKEWEFCYSNYDMRVVNVVIEAYLERNMVKEAELLREKSAEMGKGTTYKTSDLVVDYSGAGERFAGI